MNSKKNDVSCLLLESRKILCIQPHPDDMEIGAGGTIAMLSGKGAEITCLTVTDGSAGSRSPSDDPDQLAERRRIEAEAGASILGVNEMIWLDFTDGGYLPLEAVRGEITRAIRLVRPDTLMVCDPWLQYEAHSDHIRTGLAAAEAGFLSGLPNFHPADLQDNIQPHTVELIAFYYTSRPNTLIDVTSTWSLKIEAISCHKSQFSPGQGVDYITRLTEHALKLGEKSGCKYTEAFKVLSRSQLHIFEAVELE